mmetsp:Transcript_75361/g.157044  ORF Transcript_75361/g.157044 Transcript_75361/m.157044 type:complete len:142 (-) Transcript_75361:626-1051(-)
MRVVLCGQRDRNFVDIVDQYHYIDCRHINDNHCSNLFDGIFNDDDPEDIQLYNNQTTRSHVHSHHHSSNFDRSGSRYFHHEHCDKQSNNSITHEHEHDHDYALSQHLPDRFHDFHTIQRSMSIAGLRPTDRVAILLWAGPW